MIFLFRTEFNISKVGYGGNIFKYRVSNFNNRSAENIVCGILTMDYGPRTENCCNSLLPYTTQVILMG